MTGTRTNPAFDCVGAVLDAGTVPVAFQPIVDLDTEEVVAFEALARPRFAGRAVDPGDFFRQAERHGRLGDVDAACVRSAIAAARAGGLGTDHSLFVNVMPAGLNLARHDSLLSSDGSSLRLVVEINERDVVRQPAALVELVARLRERFHGIALDDVGVNPASLSLVPLVHPDVIKLDPCLLRSNPGREEGRTIRTVLSYVNSSSASLLAEGIESDADVAVARSLGARYGQGWYFGRPGPLGEAVHGPPRSSIPFLPASPIEATGSPYELIGSHRMPGAEASGDRLLAVSLDLEDMAERSPDSVLLAAFQDAPRFTPATADRYERIAREANLVVACAAGLGSEPATGVRGVDLPTSDPLHEEWSVVVRSPHSAAALIARQVADGPRLADRVYRYALTSDPAIVDAAAHTILRRVA